MFVLNFYGGPGAGKSTAAAGMFVYLKNRGYRVELAREAAKDFIWEGREVQLQRNQFLLAAAQYARLKDLSENGCEIAISDSPLVQGLIYARSFFYAQELGQLLRKVTTEFHDLNIWVERTKDYVKFGRQQTEQQARQLDADILTMWDLQMDVSMNGDEQGQQEAYPKILAQIESRQCGCVNARAATPFSTNHL